MKMRLYSMLAFALSCFACFDDKGNYDYSEFAEVVIQKMDKKYEKILFKDTLVITPEVTPGDRSYEYLWTMNQRYGGESSEVESVRMDTIGRLAVLEFPVTKPAGTYEINLKVTDKETGYAVFSNSQLVIKSEFSLGFYVLKETDGGGTEVDLHTPDLIFSNLLATSPGGAISGKPVSMGLLFQYCHIDPATAEYIIPPALTICTETDVRIVNLNNLHTIFTYDDMFFGDKPEGEKPLYIYPNFFTIVYLSTVGCNYNYQNGLGLPSIGKFGLPVPIGEPYTPDVHLIVAQSSYRSYLYDVVNCRFFAFNVNGYIDFFDEEGEIPNKLPDTHELLFFGYNNVAEEQGFAFFRDGDDRYLYSLQFDDYNNPIKQKEKIDASLALSRAVIMGNNENQASLLYYAVDGKVYMYEIQQKRESELDLAGFGGGEVTYISNRYWLSDDDKDHNFDYLAIGTHTAGKYRIYLYRTVGGIPTGQPVKILEGEGKVLKMHFLSPYMGSNDKAIRSYPCHF